MRLASSLAVVLLPGCLFGEVRIGVENSWRGLDDTDAVALVKEAIAVLGAEAHVFTGPGPRQITLELLETPSNHPGKAYQGPVCSRVGRSELAVTMIAHELGHLLGLSHVRAPTNVMFPISSDDKFDLTDEQQSAIDRRTRRLARCPLPPE